MKPLFLALLLSLAAAPALADPNLPPQIEAQNGPEKLADPALETRAVNLQRQFRCLVCQGESLDESGAPLAADLRRLIRKQILEGRQDSEIRNYLVARYGNFILMTPPLEQETWLLWFGPVLVLLTAGAIGAAAIRNASRRARENS